MTKFAAFIFLLLTSIIWVPLFLIVFAWIVGSISWGTVLGVTILFTIIFFSQKGL
jgi:hypothetical protein